MHSYAVKDRVGFEPEVTAKVAQLKLRVVEVPISFFPRNYLEGEEITWKDGIATVRHLFYFNLIVSKSRYCPVPLPRASHPSRQELVVAKRVSNQ